MPSPGLLISMREVLRKKNESEKAFQGSQEFLWAWRCETTIIFVTFIATLGLTHHTDSHTRRRFAWDDSFPNYPGVRQPCSHCCFLNKRRLLHRTEKQDGTIQCKDHLGGNKSPSQFSICLNYLLDFLSERLLVFFLINYGLSHYTFSRLIR